MAMSIDKKSAVKAAASIIAPEAAIAADFFSSSKRDKSSKAEAAERAKVSDKLSKLEQQMSMPITISRGGVSSGGWDWNKILKYIFILGICAFVIYYFGTQGVFLSGFILILGLFLLDENVHNAIMSFLSPVFSLFEFLHLGGLFSILVKILLIPLFMLILLGIFWFLVFYAKMHILFALGVAGVLFFAMLHVDELSTALALAAIMILYPLVHLVVLPNIEPDSPLAETINNFETELGLSVNIINPIDWFKRIWSAGEREIAVASGDVYSSSVDSGSRKKLGVFMTDIESTEKMSQFVKGKPFNFYARVDAQSLDFDVNLSMGCEVSKDSVVVNGEVSQKTASFISRSVGEGDFFDSLDVDCIIPEAGTLKLDTGLNTVKIFGNFNFVTRAYVNVFLIDQDRWRELSRRNLLSQITQSLPSTTAITTAGPIRLGLGAGREKQVIDIAKTGSNGPTVGLTVENFGGGFVKSLNQIFVLLPVGLSVKDVNGFVNKDDKQIFSLVTCADLVESEQKSCNENTDVVYAIYPENILTLLDKNSEENINKFVTFRIHTDVKDYASLIGVSSSPVPKRIKATVLYEYAVMKSKDIMVKEGVQI